MKTGRIKLLCSSCGQVVYRILATDHPGEQDATVYGECEGCTIAHQSAERGDTHADKTPQDNCPTTPGELGDPAADAAPPTKGEK